jgi:large subunit ribosomal protein L24
MKSIKARKQRKTYFNAPLHRKQKNIASHLEENLLLKYDRRRIPLIKGDSVRVMRGAFKGHEDKVTKIHTRDYTVEVEGVTLVKADGKKIAKPIHPSNLLITKLNLTDKWRRRNIEKRVSDETKKEIEAEAKKQLVEKEKELKRLEEEKRAAEEEERKAEEEEEETIGDEEPIKEEKTSTKVVDKKDEKEKTTTKPSQKKTTATSTKSKSKNQEKKEDKEA